MGEKGKLLGAQGARIAALCSRLRNILLWDLGENTPKRTPVPKALLCGVRGSSSPPLLVFFFFSLLPGRVSPRQPSAAHPVPQWVRGNAPACRGKRVNRMGAGGRAGGAGWGAAPPSCSGGPDFGRGAGTVAEAPHVLCFLMCSSRHGLVASNPPLTSPASLPEILRRWERHGRGALPFPRCQVKCLLPPCTFGAGDPAHPSSDSSQGISSPVHRLAPQLLVLVWLLRRKAGGVPMPSCTAHCKINFTHSPLPLGAKDRSAAHIPGPRSTWWCQALLQAL